MAKRSLSRSLRIGVVVYLAAFVFVMYCWMTGSPQRRTVRRRDSAPFALPPGVAQLQFQLQRRPGVEGAVLAPQNPAASAVIRLSLLPGRDNKSEAMKLAQRLFIAPESDNGSQAAEPVRVAGIEDRSQTAAGATRGGGAGAERGALGGGAGAERGALGGGAGAGAERGALGVGAGAERGALGGGAGAERGALGGGAGAERGALGGGAGAERGALGGGAGAERGALGGGAGAERGALGGGAGAERGALGQTLALRLESVFHSALDCPTDLPLDFLGLQGLSADLSQDPACPWIEASVRNVERNFVALGGEMAVLRDVTLDPRSFRGAKGGEAIAQVFNQNEGEEYFRVLEGFFSLPCSRPPLGVRFHVEKRNYRRSNHLNHWLSALTCSAPDGGGRKRNNDSASGAYVAGVTLALQRYEYANMYHTMLDWYNAFLALLLLGVDPRSATFLLVDGHPWGKLDASWATLFGGAGVVRAGHLPSPTTFQYMVWVPNGYHCPLFETDRTDVPFLPELREFFFKSYGVQTGAAPVCSRLRLLFVRRRDYLAHPRNPKGVLARKIVNEDEIRDKLIEAFPDLQVRAEQLDLLPMRRQLELVAQTDILVGMHGAGLTYTTLLPGGAGLVEMYPLYAGKTSMLFKQIARWRGVQHVQWMNKDPKNERPNKFTYIPPDVVVGLVREVRSKMCTDGKPPQ